MKVLTSALTLTAKQTSLFGRLRLNALKEDFSFSVCVTSSG